jgi:hypothetical protein
MEMITEILFRRLTSQMMDFKLPESEHTNRPQPTKEEAVRNVSKEQH